MFFFVCFVIVLFIVSFLFLYVPHGHGFGLFVGLAVFVDAAGEPVDQDVVGQHDGHDGLARDRSLVRAGHHPGVVGLAREITCFMV